jgi:putative transposase
MYNGNMKARYQYRIYPTDSQKHALAKLFGCVRVVWNDTLAYCQELYQKGEKKPKYTELSKRLTQLKKTEEKEWLTEVSSLPLQQSLRDLEQAYSNFFQSCQGERKGQKVKPPKFKKRKSKQSARFTNNGFKVNQHSVALPKIGDLKIVWSRPLPSKPSSVKRLKRLKKAQQNLGRKQKGSKRREKARKRVAKIHAKIKDTRTDFWQKLSTKIVRDNQTIVLEDLNTAGMGKNRKLSRAISDLGWRSFRDMLLAKSDKYGRDFRLISRWEPTSQRCSCCGNIGGKKALNVREWECLFCGTFHDRDVNAAINIKVAGGHSETKNGRRETVRLSTKEARLDEASTHQNYKQLSLF